MMKSPLTPETPPARRQTELAGLIARFASEDGVFPTAIPALGLIRSSTAALPSHSVYEPTICIVAQGAKHVSLAGESYTYGPDDYFVVTVDLPVSSRILRASPESPYLCLRLRLEPEYALEATKESDRSAAAKKTTKRGLFVDKTSPALLDAATRLVRLLETPQDIPYLAPLVIREIYYRILSGKQGGVFKQTIMTGSAASRIASVISRMKREYSRPLPIEELARMAHMGPSSLHRLFKEVTAMSPLQYQKLLRLQEARRLLLSEAVDAADAAFRVGYESPSQFSREYARLFGLPPIADIKRLRLSPGQEIG